MTIWDNKMSVGSGYVTGFFDAQGTVATKRELFDITTANLYLLQEICSHLRTHRMFEN